MKKEILGLEIGLLSSMAIAYDIANVDVDAADWVNNLDRADDILNGLNKSDADLLRNAFRSVAKASRTLVLLVADKEREDWAQMIIEWLKQKNKTENK